MFLFGLVFEAGVGSRIGVSVMIGVALGGGVRFINYALCAWCDCRRFS